MNKRVLLLSGGLFTVLLATVAIYSTYYDQSSFQASQANSADSLKILSQEKSTIFQEEMLAASSATSTAAKMNVTRLKSSVVQLYSDMIKSTDLRLTPVVSTDRLVYRNGDYVFVEVLLFDTLKKTPYIKPTTGTIPTIKATATLQKADGTVLSTFTATLGSSTPSISFILQIPAYGSAPEGTYSVVITNDVSAATRAFPETYKTIQVRTYVADDTLVSDAFATIKIFGTTHLSTDQKIYGKVVASNTACIGKTVTITPTYVQKDTNSYTTIVGVPAEFQADGAAYFEVPFLALDAQNSQDNKVKITADCIDVACDSTLITYVPITIVETPTAYTNSHVVTDFYTEANTDLVYNTTQKVYFNAYFYMVNSFYSDGSVNSFSSEPINVVNGKVKAYKISDPYSAQLTLVSSVSSDLSGHGVFSITLPDGYMPFLEFVVPGHESETGNTLGITLPYASTVTLSGGVVRVPINIKSIINEQKTIKYRELSTASSTELLVESLKALEFSILDDGNVANYIFPTPTGLTYILEEGVFIIRDTNQLPIATFNQFPNPENFTSSVLFSYVMDYPNEANEDFDTITVQVKSYDFQKVIARLADITLSAINIYAGAKSITNLAIDTTSTSTKIISLCKLFEPVEYKPYAEVTIFNTDGPIANLLEGTNGYSYLGDSVYTNVVFNKPSITFGLNARILESQDSLIVTFQTNSLMEPTDAYMLTIKQKEQVLYAEAFSFSKNTNQKRTIPYGSLNKMNGGVFSVDLYRITDFWQYFQYNTTSTTSFCDLTSIEAIAYGSWAAQDKLELNALDTYESLENFDTITEVIKNNKFTSDTALFGSGKTCIIDHPILVNEFLSQVGSAQFFRRPQPAIDVTVAATKSDYYGGETVSVTVTCKNASTSAAISSGAYLSVVVTEDLEFSEFNGYQRSIAQSLYADNDISPEYIPFNIDEVINKPYESGSSVSDKALEYFMARQRNYNQMFEVSGMLNAKYLLEAEQSMLPLSLWDLSRAYGFNFNPSDYTTNDANTVAFKQTDLTEFIKPTSSVHTQIDSILGYMRSYPHSDYQGYVAGVKDPIYNVYNTVPAQVSAAYKQALPSDYKRSEFKQLRETIYFQSGVAITSATTSITFKAGDLASKYKVRAVVVGANGIGFDESTFSISKPFNVELDYPKVMVVGETYTVSAVITNFSPEDITVNLATSPAVQTSTSIFADLATTVTSQEQQSLVVSPGQDVMTFSFQALAKDSAATVSLVFVGTNAASGNSYTSTIVINANIVLPKAMRIDYVSGIITTDTTLNANKKQFTFTSPNSAAKLATLTGSLSLQAGRFGLLQRLVSTTVEQTGADFPDAYTLIHDINMLYMQLENIEGNSLSTRRRLVSTAQTYFYLDRQTELKMKIKELFDRLQSKYLNKDSTGSCMGWDYFVNNSPNGGSKVLTAQVLSTLTDIQEIVFTDVDSDGQYLDDVPCYQQSLEWLLDKQVYDEDLDYYVGNFTFEPLDVDALGRAPWNVSQAYITYSLLNTLQLQEDGSLQAPDLYQQVKFLKTQADASYTANTAISLLTNSDPYYLALSYLTISRYFSVLANPLNVQEYSSATDAQNVALQTSAGLYIDQIKYNQFESTLMSTAANFSFDSFLPYKRHPYTAFNTYGKDRVVETTAMCVLALLDANDFLSRNEETVIENALFFIKQNYRGYFGFGSYPANLAAMQAITEYEFSGFQDQSPSTHNPYSTAQTITVATTVNKPSLGTALQTKTFTGDQALPQIFDLFTPAFLTDVHTSDTYEIEVAVTTDVSTNGHSYFVWQAEISSFDEDYTGPAEADRKIGLEVYQNADELQSAAVGESIEYRVSLLNLDRGRTHNGAQFVIRPSPCLAISTADLDFGMANGDFDSYLVDSSTHRIFINVRGVGPFGFPTFTLAFTKIYSGTCVQRPFSVQLTQSFESFVHVYPQAI